MWLTREGPRRGWLQAGVRRGLPDVTDPPLSLAGLLLRQPRSRADSLPRRGSWPPEGPGLRPSAPESGAGRDPPRPALPAGTRLVTGPPVAGGSSEEDGVPLTDPALEATEFPSGQEAARQGFEPANGSEAPRLTAGWASAAPATAPRHSRWIRPAAATTCTFFFLKTVQLNVL